MLVYLKSFLVYWLNIYIKLFLKKLSKYSKNGSSRVKCKKKRGNEKTIEYSVALYRREIIDDLAVDESSSVAWPPTPALAPGGYKTTTTFPNIH